MSDSERRTLAECELKHGNQTRQTGSKEAQAKDHRFAKPIAHLTLILHHHRPSYRTRTHVSKSRRVHLQWSGHGDRRICPSSDAAVGRSKQEARRQRPKAQHESKGKCSGPTSPSTSHQLSRTSTSLRPPSIPPRSSRKAAAVQVVLPPLILPRHSSCHPHGRPPTSSSACS